VRRAAALSNSMQPAPMQKLLMLLFSLYREINVFADGGFGGRI
jgi:hypothetical protein